MEVYVNLCLLCGAPAQAASELCSAHTTDGAEVTIRPPSVWLTLGETAAQAGLDVATIRKLIASNQLRAVKQGRSWVVTPDALGTYLASRGRETRKPGARRRAWRR